MKVPHGQVHFSMADLRWGNRNSKYVAVGTAEEDDGCLTSFCILGVGHTPASLASNQWLFKRKETVLTRNRLVLRRRISSHYRRKISLFLRTFVVAISLLAIPMFIFVIRLARSLRVSCVDIVFYGIIVARKILWSRAVGKIVPIRSLRWGWRRIYC